MPLTSEPLVSVCQHIVMYGKWLARLMQNRMSVFNLIPHFNTAQRTTLTRALSERTQALSTEFRCTHASTTNAQCDHTRTLISHDFHGLFSAMLCVSTRSTSSDSTQLGGQQKSMARTLQNSSDRQNMLFTLAHRLYVVHLSTFHVRHSLHNENLKISFFFETQPITYDKFTAANVAPYECRVPAAHRRLQLTRKSFHSDD